MSRTTGNYLYDIPPARLVKSINWRRVVKILCASVAAVVVIIAFGWRLLMGAW